MASNRSGSLWDVEYRVSLYDTVCYGTYVSENEELSERVGSEHHKDPRQTSKTHLAPGPQSRNSRNTICGKPFLGVFLAAHFSGSSFSFESKSPSLLSSSTCSSSFAGWWRTPSFKQVSLQIFSIQVFQWGLRNSILQASIDQMLCILHFFTIFLSSGGSVRGDDIIADTSRALSGRPMVPISRIFMHGLGALCWGLL